MIYFIGGYEYNNYGGTIEIWELKWDHDPAYVPSGYGACPHWCSWNDIEGMDSRTNEISRKTVRAFMKRITRTARRSLYVRLVGPYF